MKSNKNLKKKKALRGQFYLTTSLNISSLFNLVVELSDSQDTSNLSTSTFWWSSRIPIAKDILYSYEYQLTKRLLRFRFSL